MQMKSDTAFVVLLVSVVVAWIGDAKSIVRTKWDREDDDTVMDTHPVGHRNKIERSKRDKEIIDSDIAVDKNDNFMAMVGDTNRILRHKRDNDDNDDDAELDVDDGITVERRVNYHRRRSVSVHHFGKHTLCLRHKMRRDFYRALKDYYCMSDHLAAELVVSLCTSKGDVLDKFVSDIFDVDKDGFINEYEKYLPWYKK